VEGKTIKVQLNTSTYMVFYTSKGNVNLTFDDENKWIYSVSQLKQVSRIKQKLKNNLKFFVVNLMCGVLSMYAGFF
jgi:hypothetical protein